MTSFVDTNILLYAIGLKELDFPKQHAATTILASGNCAFSVQVLNEFIWQATQTRWSAHLSLEEAIALITVWRRYPVQPVDLAILDAADDIARRTRYSWWDSQIVAAAIIVGCDTLLTEDMQHGRVIDGVRIVNPFRDLA